MKMWGRKAFCALTWAIVFVQINSFSNVQGEVEKKTASVVVNSTNAEAFFKSMTEVKNATGLTQETLSEYEWSNPDDYDPDDVDLKKKQSHNNATEKGDKNPSNLEDMSRVVKDEDDPILKKRKSEAKLETKDDTTNPSTTEEFEDSSTDPSTATSDHEEADQPTTRMELPSSESHTNDPPTTESIVKTSPTFPISTQTGGGFTNYSSTEPSEEEWESSGRKTTWAVVTASVLISFAVIFTILFMIRGAVVRKRKEDQAKLMRASISSEGYFFGDLEGAEGNNGHKFQL